jgi:solute carrier family 25 carnitine/acylcarnitine transporter 20/29
MAEVVKDIFCGWLSGIGQVLTMMPFENIKIKMVSKRHEYTGYLQTFTKTVTEEGVMAFYKGMLVNLLGVGPQVALQFGVVETLKKYIKRNIQPDKDKLSLPFVTLSGFVAGLPSALVLVVPILS